MVDCKDIKLCTFELMKSNPQALTGMMVVLNTLSNIILENEKEVA